MTGHREARQRPGVSRQNTSNVERDERRPLLSRARFPHSMDGEQFFSCNTNAHAHLPVYTNIHRIRRDVVSIVEDYLTIEQLRDLRLNISVVRPLVDKLYELDDISIGMHPFLGSPLSPHLVRPNMTRWPHQTETLNRSLTLAKCTASSSTEPSSSTSRYI